MLLQLGSEESPSLCQPTLPCSCLSLKPLYWVKNKRKQTFIFSVVMLIKQRTLALLCSASVSWHPPCSDFLLHHLPKSWPAAGPQPALPVTSGSHGDGAPGTCRLSCANNMKALAGGGFPKKHSNPFSKWLQLLVLGHSSCYSDQMLASQKELLSSPPPFFKSRYIFISRSDGFANFLRHLL